MPLWSASPRWRRWFRVERAGWQQHLDWGLTEFRVITWSDPYFTKYAFFNALVIATFCVAVVGIALLIAARAPFPVVLYTVLVFLSCLLSSGATTKPRFVLTAVGIFIGAGAKLPRLVFWPVLVVSAALLAFTVGWMPHNIPTDA